MDRFYWNYKTPGDFSDMVMFSDGEYLTGLSFYTPQGCDFNRWSRKKNTADAFCAGSAESMIINGSGVIKKRLPVFEETTRWLDEYFGKDADGNFTRPSSWPDFTPPIKIYGLTPFREKVLNTIRTIPFGATMTYGQIAASIAAEGSDASSTKAKSAQAVGGAVGWNPICLIIPCHRVMGAGNKLTGYGGGLINKIALLDMEGVITTAPSVQQSGHRQKQTERE